MFKFVKFRLFPQIINSKARFEFLFVDNLVSAITDTINNSNTFSEIYNITDGQSYSVNEVMREIARGYGVGPSLVKLPFFVAYLVLRPNYSLNWPVNILLSLEQLPFGCIEVSTFIRVKKPRAHLIINQVFLSQMA